MNWATSMSRWDLHLEIDEHARLPLTAQIAHGVAAAVRGGRLAPGAPLPGSRTLARSLGVSRNTVAAAYDELVAEGWVTTDGPRGTCISSELPEPRVREFTDAPVRRRWDEVGYPLEAVAPRTEEPAQSLRGILRWDFGIPDERLSPARELARGYRR